MAGQAKQAGWQLVCIAGRGVTEVIAEGAGALALPLPLQAQEVRPARVVELVNNAIHLERLERPVQRGRADPSGIPSG